MQVKLLKDWGRHKKGAPVEITDQTLLKKGVEIGLFEEVKLKKEDKNKV